MADELDEATVEEHGRQFADRVVVHRTKRKGETGWTAWAGSHKVATSGEGYTHPEYAMARAGRLAVQIGAELCVETTPDDVPLQLLAQARGIETVVHVTGKDGASAGDSRG